MTNLYSVTSLALTEQDVQNKKELENVIGKISQREIYRHGLKKLMEENSVVDYKKAKQNE